MCSLIKVFSLSSIWNLCEGSHPVVTGVIIVVIGVMAAAIIIYPNKVRRLLKPFLWCGKMETTCWALYWTTLLQKLMIYRLRGICLIAIAEGQNETKSGKKVEIWLAGNLVYDQIRILNNNMIIIKCNWQAAYYPLQ